MHWSAMHPSTSDQIETTKMKASGCESTNPLLAYPVARLGLLVTLLAVILSLAVSGCSKQPQFRLNEVHKLTLEKELRDGDEIPAERVKELGNVMTALFGTPSDPRLPYGADFIDMQHLVSSAGPVSSDREGKGLGLYREHCAHCHGITGDGAGPTASFMNPYPRDFRLGKFKFKSTKTFHPPLPEDLKYTLQRGIAGTSMPSFALLPEEEIDALVAYVQYLSIRGQVERALLDDMAILEDDESLMSSKDSTEPDDYEFQLELIVERISPILNKWKRAQSKLVLVPAVPAGFQNYRNSFANAGKQLFYGKANCVQCHGETGVGDGQTENYDEWTNEWLKRGNVDLNKPEDLKEYTDIGALKPRKIRPRNLRHRVFRGGSSPDDLFRRIKVGIEGTPMAANANLSDEDIWSLIAYVLDLSNEKVDGVVRKE